MAYTEAQKRATMKYREKNYARINLDLKREKKEQYRAQAEKRGLSLNAYIISLIEKDMKEGTSLELIHLFSNPQHDGLHADFRGILQNSGTEG